MINKNILIFSLFIILYFLLDVLINREINTTLKAVLIVLGGIITILVFYYIQKNYDYRTGFTKERAKKNLKALEESGFFDAMAIVTFLLSIVMLGFGIWALFQNGDKRIGWFLIILLCIFIVMLLSHILKNKERIFK